MELDAFKTHLGEKQGRIKPTLFPAQADEHVFVLGSEDESLLYELAPGDHAQITQIVDVTEAHLFRAHLSLRVPEKTPEGFFWKACLLVDGEVQAQAVTRPRQSRILSDLAANVSKLEGEHVLGIRLELGA